MLKRNSKPLLKRFHTLALGEQDWHFNITRADHAVRDNFHEVMIERSNTPRRDSLFDRQTIEAAIELNDVKLWSSQDVMVVFGRPKWWFEGHIDPATRQLIGTYRTTRLHRVMANLIFVLMVLAVALGTTFLIHSLLTDPHELLANWESVVSIATNLPIMFFGTLIVCLRIRVWPSRSAREHVKRSLEHLTGGVWSPARKAPNYGFSQV